MIAKTEVDNEVTSEKIMKVNSNVGILTYTTSNLALGITGTVSYVLYDSLGSVSAATNVSFGKCVYFHFMFKFKVIL